jgi:pyrroline-5-carboxylate reductase
MGSALYITKGNKTFTESISTVASKWGITQKALDTFAEKGLKDIIDAWLHEAYDHWNKLSEST